MIPDDDIFHAAAVPADKMLMVRNICIKMLNIIEPPNPADHTVICQKMQIAIHRSQTDIGNHLAYILVNDIRGRMILPAI